MRDGGGGGVCVCVCEGASRANRGAWACVHADGGHDGPKVFGTFRAARPTRILYDRLQMIYVPFRRLGTRGLVLLRSGGPEKVTGYIHGKKKKMPAKSQLSVTRAVEL